MKGFYFLTGQTSKPFLSFVGFPRGAVIHSGLLRNDFENHFFDEKVYKLLKNVSCYIRPFLRRVDINRN